MQNNVASQVSQRGRPQSSSPPSNANLPVGQLESTRFKITQIMESIVALQYTVECDGQNVMPAWPDILAKYNVLLSQTLNLSKALVPAPPSAEVLGHDRSKATTSTKPFTKLALHPSPVDSGGNPSDATLDKELIPLLRNQQTTEVLRLESDVVRRLSSRLPIPQTDRSISASSDNHTAIIQACRVIKEEHDARCDRAARAVSLLREKYDWRARVAVELEEPEEFVPMPMSPQYPLSPYASNRMSPLPPPFSGTTGVDSAELDVEGDEEGDGDDEMAVDADVRGLANGDEEEEDSGDEAELEEVLGLSLRPSLSPGATPRQTDSVASTPR